MEQLTHTSVLLNEITNFLLPALERSTDPFLVDLTFGRGGHTIHLMEKLPNLKVLAIDQDADAIAAGVKIIEQLNLDSRLTLVHSNFQNFSAVLENYQARFNRVFPQAMLMDLGVSSPQLDSGIRGMSFRQEAELDMRMDQSADIATAKDLLASLSPEKLTEIFSTYGEERLAKRIALKIIETRRTRPINTTSELENIIFHCYPPNKRHGRIHPATRCFQALRIAVNRELEVLEAVLPDLFDHLSVLGRLAIISFHSLEDRIVKHFFRGQAKANPEKFSILTKKPIVASDEEITANLRSRSAKLRVIEKIH